ncbi:MAG: hypothetical protein VZR11_05430 [Succinimonas sp.]|nr:hypothetical protein [Succinimonas sp.]
MIVHSLTKLSVALMACMGLAACGHHSNSNNHNDDEIRVDVQVLDGALADARIFADLNRNHEWDSDEPRVTVGGDGKGTLTVPKDLLKDSAGNMATHFNIVSESSSGDKDSIYDASTSLKSPVVMSREVFEGSSGRLSITPFTTYV